MEMNLIKRIEYDILNEVVDFCEKNDLKYTLFYGTLLGAIRHNGFIPWDDDIDIAMPRDDYQFLLSTFFSEKYVLVDCNKSSSYFYPFAKVYNPLYRIKENGRFDCKIGIYIDIFPIDYIDKCDYKKFSKKIIWMHKMWSRAIDPKNVNSKSIIRKFYSKWFNINRTNLLAKKMEQCAIRYSRKEKDIGLIYLDLCGNPNSIYDKELFKTKLVRFEDRLFCCPQDFDSVLTNLYGDYMKLPPEENRVNTHGFTLVDYFEK